MGMQSSKLVKCLFETDAIRVCQPDRPFWYTSGTIGPYYINAHFLYGSEDKANKLLEIIDKEKENPALCPEKILELAKVNYDETPVYRNVIDEICAFIKNQDRFLEFDFISGGERRDWFFSILTAYMLGKPHLTIYKNLSVVLSQDGRTIEVKDINGGRVLHIADLITEASSYERFWIPAIKRIRGHMNISIAVVDRKQGGAEYLESQGIKLHALICIDKGLFDQALELGIINPKQHHMILDYIANPRESMKGFLKQHPEFLEEALNSDEKTRERARLCIERDIYGLRLR